jgi:hypothetical protein
VPLRYRTLPRTFEGQVTESTWAGSARAPDANTAFFTFFHKYRPRYHKIDERYRESICKSPQITSRLCGDLRELSLLTVLG